MMGKKIFFTKEIQPYHSTPNHSRSKCHSGNVIDINCNLMNKLDNKELWLDNFEGLK